MRENQKLSRTYWFSSLIIVVVLGISLGTLFIFSEFIVYTERIKNIENSYLSSRESMLRREAERITEFIKTEEEFEIVKHSIATDKAEAIAYIKNIKFDNGGYVFITDTNSKIIIHPEAYFIGKKLNEITDDGGKNIGDEILKTAGKKNGGFIQYQWKSEDLKKSSLHLTYITMIREWNWIVGATVPVESTDKLIKQDKALLNQNIIERILLIITILVLFIIIATVWFFQLSQRIKKELNIFIEFFKNLSGTHKNIDKNDLSFSEILELADYANQMNHDILQKTRILNKEIQERRQIQEELTKLSQAVHQSPTIVMITDLKGRIEYVNPKFTEITGFSYEEAVGKTPVILNSGLNPPEFYQDMWKTILSGKEWKGEFYNKKKNGELYWEIGAISAIRNTRGKITHFLKVSDDLSERKRLEQNLEYMARHDMLTELPNRVLFHDRLNLAIKRAHRTKRIVAVLILDLDNFKTVNDTLGHDAGDVLLKLAVKRFIKYIREGDTASRMGGDEFNFIINDLATIEDLKKIVVRMLESFRKPFIIHGNTVNITASIGISLYPGDGEDIENLVKNCDIALYRVKESGKNNYRFFNNFYN